ncbi:MAG: thioredoxin [bacterium]
MDNIITLNEKNFNQEVIDSEKPVLVDFWAPWCSPCKMMAPILEELNKDNNSKLKIGKLNTDENQAIATNYGITGIPTLIIFKNGEPAERIVGVLPKEEIQKKIDSSM